MPTDEGKGKEAKRRNCFLAGCRVFDKLVILAHLAAIIFHPWCCHLFSRAIEHGWNAMLIERLENLRSALVIISIKFWIVHSENHNDSKATEKMVYENVSFNYKKCDLCLKNFSLNQLYWFTHTLLLITFEFRDVWDMKNSNVCYSKEISIFKNIQSYTHVIFERDTWRSVATLWLERRVGRALSAYLDSFITSMFS